MVIKNPPLFAIGLCAVAVGAAVRHIPAIHGMDLPLLLLDVRLWVGIGALFFVLSAFIGGRAVRAVAVARDHFVPVPISDIGARVQSWSDEAEPDIPLIVDFIVYQAIHANASDIHFDPSAAGMNVRYRVQGLVKSVAALPRTLTPKVINRLKVLSNLVIYKDILPQDGRFDRANEPAPESTGTVELKRSGLHRTDFRIAFMPTLHGERIVIRILGAKNEGADLSSLGMEPADLETLRRLIRQPQGMIILTGPTGSGKTTTIFAAIGEILQQSGKNRSVATLEDPIEFDIPDIAQSQVNEERDFTFEKGLRAVLRQDPDVIMVGEIRDAETAKIAIQAGMTGHLMITTVHAGTSAAAFARLLEMGIPTYSLNSAVTAVVAQRLVRRICPSCRTEMDWTPADLTALGLDTPPDWRPFRGAGCPACEQTGYLSRVAIYEILEVTEPIRKLISAGADSGDIYHLAREQGMRTLNEAAMSAVRSGVTTVEEVSRNISIAMK